MATDEAKTSGSYRLNTRISNDLKRKLEVFGGRVGLDLNDVVRKALVDLVEKLEYTRSDRRND